MTRPKLLDLFCCEGGAGMGYARAGFDVTGVDIVERDRYPFTFIQADALRYLEEHGHEYAAIHASPPCQGYTTMSNRYVNAQAEWPKLIEPARDALQRTGKPYVIENVVGAKREMRNPIKLSGGMFGLGVERPRLFESNVPLVALPYRPADPVIGVYGRHHDGRRLWTRRDGTELRAAKTLMEGRLAMGIGWMGWGGLTEAIPPAYTEYIGQQLMQTLKEVADA